MTDRRIYLDACCYVAVVKGEPEAAMVKSILQRVEAGDRELWASTLVYAEVARDNETVNSYLKPPLIRYAEVSFQIAAAARQAVLDLGLSGADAVHVATAVKVGCEVLFTKDDSVLKADGYEGLKVSYPEELDGQITLDPDLDVPREPPRSP